MPTLSPLVPPMPSKTTESMVMGVDPVSTVNKLVTLLATLGSRANGVTQDCLAIVALQATLIVGELHLVSAACKGWGKVQAS